MVLLIICLFVLSLISPFSGVLLAFICILRFHKNKQIVLVSLFYLSFFLGLLNSIKLPESDLINYINIFHKSSGINFISFAFFTGREPLFYIFTKVVNYLSFDNESIYIISFTILSYYILFYALWRAHNHYNLKGNNFFLAVLCAFLFPNLFSLSSHLVRQFIASSFILLFLVNKFCYNKKSLVYLIVASLFHSTSLIFAICYLPFFKNKLSPKRSLYFLFIIPFLVLQKKILSILATLFSKSSLLSYLISRATQDNSTNPEPLSSSVLFLTFLVILLFYVTSKKLKLKIRCNSIFSFLYLSIFLLVFVLANINNGIIAMRFAFYMYFFLPLGFYFLLSLTKSKLLKVIVQLTLILVFIFWFVYKLNNGVWTYNNWDSVV